MLYPNFRFVYNRRNNGTLSKKASVEIEITYNGKQKRIGTNVRLLVNQWDKKRMRVCDRTDAPSLNKQLETQMKGIMDATNDIMSGNEQFTFDLLEATLRRRLKETFIDFVEERISSRRDIKKSTLDHHKSWYNIFRQQGYIKYYSDLTLYNIKKYDSWLHQRGISQATIWSHHKRLKVYIHEAMAMGMVNRNPYIGFRVSRGGTAEIKYLRVNEVKRIRSLVLEPVFDNVRDLFIIQCYTGLSYADLMSVNWNDVQQHGDHYVLVDNRKKTKERYYIVLLQPVVDILVKHGYSLRRISNQKYNNYLKVVGALAGIKTRLTTHVGRHTFATMMLNEGVPIDIVAKMLGHSTSKTTSIYAEVLSESVELAYLEVGKKIR